MNTLNLDEVREYANEHIVDFHQKRLSRLAELDLDDLIKKNPYLFRAKNITRADELIESTLSAFLSSSEEKMFGDFLEDLAIWPSLSPRERLVGTNRQRQGLTWNSPLTDATTW